MLEIVTPALVLAKCASPIAEAIRTDMGDFAREVVRDSGQYRERVSGSIDVAPAALIPPGALP